ncbi:hypothetical protein FPV67DRAFT_814366 [Lyophyllum atratum]|nr:hypothetical protein FPV67DRAFT_814366 [Lyophyllum atratum]
MDSPCRDHRIAPTTAIIHQRCSVTETRSKGENGAAPLDASRHHYARYTSKPRRTCFQSPRPGNKFESEPEDPKTTFSKSSPQQVGTWRGDARSHPHVETVSYQSRIRIAVPHRAPRRSVLLSYIPRLTRLPRRFASGTTTRTVILALPIILSWRCPSRSRACTYHNSSPHTTIANIFYPHPRTRAPRVSTELGSKRISGPKIGLTRVSPVVQLYCTAFPISDIHHSHDLSYFDVQYPWTGA